MNTELIIPLKKKDENINLLKTFIVSQNSDLVYVIEYFNGQQKQGNEIVLLELLTLSDKDKTEDKIFSKEQLLAELFGKHTKLVQPIPTQATLNSEITSNRVNGLKTSFRQS